MTSSAFVRLLLGLGAAALAGCGGPSGPPQLSAGETTFLFDTVRGKPVPHSFHWTNVGGRDTAPLVVTLTGDVDSFHVVTDACSGLKLAAGKTCTVDIELANDVAGPYDG
jgi:hypothetical protein